MKKMNSVAIAITNLEPNAKFSVTNNDVDQIVWYEDQGSFVKPSKEQIVAEVERLEADYQRNYAYIKTRSYAYPPLSEFADAFYWMQKGDSSKMEQWVSKCDNIKAMIPKPE